MDRFLHPLEERPVSASFIPVEGELTLFRPKKFKIKKRVETRYRSGPATLGKVTFPQNDQVLEAVVHNISRTGIGLNMPFAVEVGQEIAITIRTGLLKPPQRLVGRIVHATEEVDKSWRVGCEFSEPLNEVLLEELLE